MKLSLCILLLALVALAPSASAGDIPSFALGEFSRTWENGNCIPDENTTDCERWSNTNFLTVQNIASTSAMVSFEIYGANGHLCSGSGIAEWKKGALRLTPDGAPDCKVRITFSKAIASIRSNGSASCSSICGARSQIWADLPKTSNDAANDLQAK